MSYQAQTWASKCKTDSIGAQFILVVLANYADESGECFPSISTLAEQTRQSPATVRRRLRDLEEQGFIERVEQFRSNGTQTVNIFRLLMGQNSGSEGMGVPSQSERGTLSICEGDPLTSERGTQSSVIGQEPSFEPSYEPIPPLPPEGGVACGLKTDEGDEANGGDAPDATQFDAFWGAYPSDPADTEYEAQKAWARLSVADRAKALIALPRYLEHCRTKPLIVRAAKSYLRNRVFEGFQEAPAKAAPAPRPEVDPIIRAVDWACSAAPRDDWPFVGEGTEAWGLWHAAFRHAGRPFAVGRSSLVLVDGGYERRIGRHFPTMEPPKLPGSDPPGAPHP